MEAVVSGYSGKTLAEKLGLRAGLRALLYQAPEHYPALLGSLASELDPVESAAFNEPETLDFAHAFFTEKEGLARDLAWLGNGIKRRGGMLWISWPKKASKVPTDITEESIRELALPLGLVDVKVCAVDEVWSGLKLVWRK